MQSETFYLGVWWSDNCSNMWIIRKAIFFKGHKKELNNWKTTTWIVKTQEVSYQWTNWKFLADKSNNKRQPLSFMWPCLVLSTFGSTFSETKFMWIILLIMMIGKSHEKDFIGMLETLKDTTESQWVMNLLIYKLRSGTDQACYGKPLSRSNCNHG